MARAVSCPVTLYTNPKFQNWDFSVEALKELAEEPNIQYLKDASGNVGKLMSIVTTLGDRIKLFSDTSSVPLFVFLIGGVGWMSGPACVIPEQSIALYETARQGRWEEAAATSEKAMARQRGLPAVFPGRVRQGRGSRCRDFPWVLPFRRKSRLIPKGAGRSRKSCAMWAPSRSEARLRNNNRKESVMKIMVGYDGSNASKEAVKVAKKRAKATDATVYVLTSMVQGSEKEQRISEKPSANSITSRPSLTGTASPVRRIC